MIYVSVLYHAIYMHIYVYVSVQTIMLHLKLTCKAVCHLYLNETEREGKQQVLSKHGKENKKKNQVLSLISTAIKLREILPLQIRNLAKL